MSWKQHRVVLCACLLFVSVWATSCGKYNSLEGSTTLNDKEKASVYIQKGNYDAAISGLETYVSANPTDYPAQSMLANVYLLKAGIDTLSLSMAINAGISSAKNNLYAILNAFPTGTATNLSYINSAISAMQTIPSASLSSDQTLEYVVAELSLAVMTLKKDCVDTTTGTLSTTLAASISTTDASTIYSAISTVNTTLSSLGATSGSNSALQVLYQMTSQILSAGGSTSAQQLATYLANNA